MGKRNAPFELRTSRTRHEVGASGMSAGLVVTVIASGITQIALEELWRYIKSLLPESAVPWTPVEWLRQLDEDELAQALQSQIASALDRRRSELTLVQLLRDKNEISAVFDADDDTRYVIRATETLYLIRHVSNPARPRASPKPGGA
jgi:hypothetical protein